MAYGSSPYVSDSYGGIHPTSANTKITSFTLDAHVGTFKQFSLDTVLLREFSKILLLDAILLKTVTPTFNIDTILVLRPITTITLDGFKQKEFSKLFNINGNVIKGGVLKSFTLDSILVFRREIQFILDGLKQKTQTATFGLSARCYPGLFWLRPWRYRKKINLVSLSANAQLNSIYNITLHYPAGTDNCNDVYLNVHAKTNFSDIRFTKQDGQTKLLYHLKAFTASSTGVVDILIDYIPSAGNDEFIYIYYGNPAAQDASTRDLVGASFFDGGEMFVNGETLTDNGWLINLSTGGNGIYSNARAFTGTMSLKLLNATGAHSNVAVWNGAISQTKDFIVQGYLYDSGSANVDDFGAFGLGTSTGEVLLYFGWERNTNGDVYMKNISGVRNSLGISRSVGWHLIKITYDATNQLINAWFDGIQVITNSSYIFVASPHLFLGQFDNSGVWFDNVEFFQNIANLDCSTFGLEEKIPTPGKFFSHRVGLRVITG